MGFKKDFGYMQEQLNWGKFDVQVYHVTEESVKGQLTKTESKNPLTNKIQYTFNTGSYLIVDRENALLDEDYDVLFSLPVFKENLEKIFDLENYPNKEKKLNIVVSSMPKLDKSTQEKVETIINDLSEKYKDDFNVVLMEFEKEKVNEFRDEYSFLSNFHPVEIEFKGRKYKSVEMAFMAEKTDDENWKDKCSQAEIKDFGKIKKESRTVKLREDWEKYKFPLMANLIERKFQHPTLRKKLLETGNKTLVEGNHWNDKEWGFCLKTNQGKNMLGRTLMFVRDKIRQQELEYDNANKNRTNVKQNPIRKKP